MNQLIARLRDLRREAGSVQRVMEPTTAPSVSADLRRLLQLHARNRTGRVTLPSSDRAVPGEPSSLSMSEKYPLP